MSKKLKANITSQEAQRFVDEVMNDRYPLQSRGKEILDLIDRDKLNEEELIELDEAYAFVENKNKKIQADLFNEQVKSDGEVDALGSPISIGLKEKIEKAKIEFQNQPIDPMLIDIIRNSVEPDVTDEEVEQIVAGLIQDKADEQWSSANLMFDTIGENLGNKIQEVARKNEKVAKDSIVRKKTRPKASVEEIEALKKRNDAIRKRYEYLTRTYKSQRAFEILEREYNIKYSSLQSIVYKP